MKRTDITMKDVFVSWTGRDRELKDRTVQFLTCNGISCLESDESCSGDFGEWSREAVGACSVFLLILTENTLQSQYVPIEVEELKKLDDWQNRVVPVCASMELYQKHSWGLHESESAVILNGQMPTEEQLAAILRKTVDLLIHRQYSVYCAQSNQNHIALPRLMGIGNITAQKYPYDSLYIPRSITASESQESEYKELESPRALLKDEDILFISGPAGSGKTQYIHQIRSCADENDLVISLSCSKLARSDEDLLDVMYREFERVSGVRGFYSMDNFKRLLSVKHLVLVLDGMDEIATQIETEGLVGKVDAFYQSNSQNVTLLFTSRNPDDANSIALGSKKIKRFLLQKLTDNQTERLVQKLFSLFDAPERADEFYARLGDLDEKIRSNPLLLSQLAVVYHKTGKIPQTTVGIYDAVCEILFQADELGLLEIRNRTYRDMLGHRELVSILKAFSLERYRLLSQRKNIEVSKIFGKILKERYGVESRDRAAFLVEYLQKRSILVDDEFYHKTFLEYFTAVAYYEQAVDDYDELADVGVLSDLFAHYADAYWSEVIKLFLEKADACMTGDATEDLYDGILQSSEIREYTLLFDICRDLTCNREAAQLALVCDILSKSANGTYPPYGPLFWYVPEYELYETAVHAAERLSGNAGALALVRDVCFIFGRKYTVASVTHSVDGAALYRAAKPSLSGVRNGLVELFCVGRTDCEQGADIYPRCFNLAEARNFMEHGQGVFGRMSSLFEDELALWGVSYPELNGEYIGFVSCPYHKTEMEETLREKPTVKVRGLALLNTEDTEMKYMKFYQGSVRALYIPENTRCITGRHVNLSFDQDMQLDLSIKLVDGTLVYLPRNIRKIVVPSGIQRLSGAPCKDQEFLEEVDLPDELIEIGDSAFADCVRLPAIKIPTTVKRIGDSAFAGCIALRDLILPDSLETIGTGAFSGCDQLIEVVIPKSMKEVDGFSGCKNLRRVILPESVTKIGSFLNCISLREINIPFGVTQIGSFAFNGCTCLQSIDLPDSVNEIGMLAFKNCTSLKSIRLSKSLGEIGIKAFANCVNLHTIAIPDSVWMIGMGAFWGCTNLSRVSIPESVEEISMSVFMGCTSLKEVVLPLALQSKMHVFPSWVKVICKETGVAFPRNQLAKEFILEDGRTEIYEGEFLGAKIETADLPNAVKTIGAHAFESCKDLREIKIPNSVTRIEDSAFCACSSLETIVIPHSVVEIGKFVFYECVNLRSVTLSRSILKIGESTFESCEKLGSISIPESVKIIEDGAFWGCATLESIVIPNSVEQIGDNAFGNCKNLKEITLSGTLKVIGALAFYKCRSLRKIVIPNSVEKIEDNVFRGCEKLEEIVLPKSLLELSGFTNCKRLRCIKIPDSVRVVGLSAFQGCEALEKIELSNSLLEIETRAFARCSSLSKIKIPESVSDLGYAAFQGCSNLRSINIPAKVSKISNQLFADCTSLSSIDLPNAVEEIGVGAFMGCTALCHVNIPERVTKICYRAFAECASLEDIEIPDRVSEIGEEAFLNCASLTSIAIPKGVCRIGDNVFCGCTGLTSVTISKNFKNDVFRIFGDIDPDILHWIN